MAARPLTVSAKDQKTTNEALKIARGLVDISDPNYVALFTAKPKTAKPPAASAAAAKRPNAPRRSASPLCRTRWELAAIELSKGARSGALEKIVMHGRSKVLFDTAPAQNRAVNSKAHANAAAEGKTIPSSIEARAIPGSDAKEIVCDVHLEGVTKPGPKAEAKAWSDACEKELLALPSRHFLCFMIWAVRWSRHNPRFVDEPLACVFQAVVAQRKEQLAVDLATELKCDPPKHGNWYETAWTMRPFGVGGSHLAWVPGNVLLYFAERLVLPSKSAYEMPDGCLTGSVARKLSSDALENALGRFGAEFSKTISQKDQATIKACAKLTEDAMVSVPIGLTRIFTLFSRSSSHAMVCSKVSAYTRCAAVGMLLLLWHSELMKCYGPKHPSASDLLQLL